MRQSIVFSFLAMVFAVCPALAQDAVSAQRITQLHSDSMETRVQVSKDLYGHGIDDPATFDAIAQVLTEGLDAGVTKDSPRLDELAWHVKALGGSGHMAYLPIIERVAQSDVRWLRNWGKAARETLDSAAKVGRPFLDYPNVRIITDRQTEQCKFIKQNTCQTGRSADKCIESHQANAVLAGADSVHLLMTSSQTGMLSLFGSDTIMMAGYYDCRQAADIPAPAPATAP